MRICRVFQERGRWTRASRRSRSARSRIRLAAGRKYRLRRQPTMNTHWSRSTRRTMFLKYREVKLERRPFTRLISAVSRCRIRFQMRPVLFVSPPAIGSMGKSSLNGRCRGMGLIADGLILSFVPDGEQRIWRSMTLMKLQLTRDRVRLQNQMECLLEEMRIKLSMVVSNLLGRSEERRVGKEGRS